MAPLVMQRGVIPGVKMWGTTLVMLKDLLPTSCCYCRHCMWAPCTASGLVLWTLLTWKVETYLRWRSRVLNKTSSHKQKNIWVQTSFQHGCGKMLCLPKLILTTDGTIGYAKRGDPWCQDVRHHIGDAEGPLTYQLLLLQALYVGPLHCQWAGVVDLVDLEGRTYLRWRSRVLNKTSSHVWGSWYLSMFLLRDGSFAPINMVSLMALGMVCDYLSTLEEKSNLVWCPEVLAWS